MTRMMLKSKIHRATVTDRHQDHVGSITVDPVLLEAELVDHEPVDGRNRARREVC